MNLIIFGSGGHGWKSLKNFLENDNISFNFWYLPVDWGGFTGCFGRVLEFSNLLNDNKKVFKNEILPWGDINKLIAYYMKYNKQNKLADIYNERFDISTREGRNNILEKILIFNYSITGKINKNKEITNVCLEWFDNYDAYMANQILTMSIDYKELNTKGSIANFYNHYLYLTYKNCDKIYSFYKQYGIVPLNININFFGDGRLELVGRDISGVILKGEDVIDISTLPIIPNSIYLKTINKNEDLDYNFKLLAHNCNISDYIIIPNGSIANWLPLLKNLEIRKSLKAKSSQGKLIWMMNMFRTDNEFEFCEYVEQLKKYNIHPIIIGPRLEHLSLDKHTIKSYESESKRLNPIENCDAQNYFGCLDIINYGEVGDDVGVKYNPATVAKVLKFLIK